MSKIRSTNLICQSCGKGFVHKGRSPGQRKYCDACLKAKKRERRRRNYLNNREKQLLYSAERYLKNKDNKTEEYRSNARLQFLLRRMEVIMLKGGKCERCGFDNAIALTFHHCDGMKERRQDYMKQDYDLSKVQLLCANCHTIEHKRNCEFYSNNTAFHTNFAKVKGSPLKEAV